MIVITTPTGDIGNKVLTNTLDSGESVRVIVRDPSRASSTARVRGLQTPRCQARGRSLSRREPADRPQRCFATRKGLPRTFRHPCKVAISTPTPTDRDSFTN